MDFVGRPGILFLVPLSFGWSPSAYVYHTLGLRPSHFIHSNNMPLSQYIDDRHVGQMCLLQCYNSNWSNIDLANAAAFIASIVLVSCGYFIGLKKSILSPVQVIPFLGFLSDSTKQAFLLPEGKKLKFATLRDSLIESKVISAKSLQRFAGKIVSFSFAVPAAKLFCREVNFNLRKALKNSKPIKMSDDLKKELQYWKFLDSWDGFLPRRKESHFIVNIISDASNTGWGGNLALPGAPKETRDYWSPDDLEVSGGIAVKEAKALYQTLSIFRNELANGRVDAYVDNSSLIDFWNNEGGRNIILTNEIEDLFLLSMDLNIALNMRYVLSKLNMADPPSRFYSDLDCALSTPTWNLVDKAFGPHSFDLIALPSNVKKSRNGCNLKFYSP